MKKQPKTQPGDLPKTSAPAQRALAGIGVQNLKQLSKYSEAEILALHGMSPNALEKLRQALAQNGLSFKK